MVDKLSKMLDNCQLENVNKPVPADPVLPTEDQSFDDAIDRLQETGRKILVLGDSSCKGSSLIFRRFLCTDNEICTITKPNTTMEGVVESVDQLTKHYTKKDYIIIMVGRDSVLQGGICNFECILNKLKALSHTNCILVTIPYVSKRDTVNNYIYKLNSRIYTLLKHALPDVVYCDINSLISSSDIDFSNAQLGHSGKVKLFRYLTDIITGPNFRLTKLRKHVM